MSLEEIRVPDIGDFKDVDVIEVMIKEGDRVRRDQSLVTVESDKASMEIPSPVAGIVRELKVTPGDKVSEGSVLLMMEAEETASEKAKPAPLTSLPEKNDTPPEIPSQPAAQPAATPEPMPEPGGASRGMAHASPSIRKFARELGVDLARVRGSGPKERILREDILAFVKSAIAGKVASGEGLAEGYRDFPPWPSLDFSQLGATEVQPLTRIKRISGPSLHRNLSLIPHVTQYEDADVTELEAFRQSENKRLEAEGVRLTMLSFVIKACVTVLKQYPQFNASLDAKKENLILKHYYHVGFAADTAQGLMVPVVRNVDQKGVIEIAKEVAALAEKARDGRLGPSEMQGASFTITSLGGIGGTYFTPFINAPEVAIIGLSRMSMKPVWNGKAFVPRMILPLSLAYDHRAIDGADGARFIAALAGVLGDMKKTLL